MLTKHADIPCNHASVLELRHQANLGSPGQGQDTRVWSGRVSVAVELQWLAQLWFQEVLHSCGVKRLVQLCSEQARTCGVKGSVKLRSESVCTAVE
jgi:hypothetical protein